MLTVCQGWLYARGQAAGRRVTVVPEAEGLALWRDGARLALWPYADIRQTGGRHAGDPVRFAQGDEALLVHDSGILTAIQGRNAAATRHFLRPRQAAWRTILYFGAAMASIFVLLLGAYLWGLPAASRHLAARVSPAWEAQIGRQVVRRLSQERPVCDSPPARQAVRDLVRRLAAAAPGSSYRFHVVILDSPDVNALAAPGGYLVVYSGLLRRAGNADELAGVLAHEMQHVLQRHGTQALFRQAGAALLLSALLGDAHGVGAAVLQAASNVQNLHYSRQNESDADRGAVLMMAKAGINPAGLIDFFQELRKTRGDVSGAARYLSTHPSTGDRIAALEKIARQVPGPFAPVLPRVDWEQVRTGCPAGPAV